MSFASIALSDFLASLAAKSPTPGGGASAAFTGATGAATAGMVVSYSIGKKDLAWAQAQLSDASAKLAAMRQEFLELADSDARAYLTLNTLQKLAPGDEKRIRELPGAIGLAIDVPVRCLTLARDLAKLCLELAPMTNTYLKSDLAIGAILAGATAQCSLVNVRINLPLLDDVAKREEIGQQCGMLAADAQRLATKAAGACG
jgi:methenyltetrahydrofolate cyclohydrolase